VLITDMPLVDWTIAPLGSCEMIYFMCTHVSLILQGRKNV